MTTTPLPCPFCGHVGLEFREGSSFRWLLAECGSCGASCGETRIQTLGNGNPLEWADAAKADAVKQWNERAPATAPPTPAWHDAPETIALQLELASAKEAYLNACKLVADMHAAAVGEVTGPRLGVVKDVAAIKAERDAAMKDAERYRWLTRTSDTNKFMVCDTDTQILYFGWEADEAIDAAIAKAEGRKE